MYPIRQSARQPLKTLTGILIVTLAVAVLCVCLGQAVTAWNMEENLDRICTSSALITEKYLYTGSYDPRYGISYHITTDLPDDVVQWMYDMAQQYPDIVEGVNRPGLASAYIPELTPDSYTRYFVDMSGSEPMAFAAFVEGSTYAMLEITLDEFTAVPFYMPGFSSSFGDDIGGSKAFRVELTGTIESVLGLPAGYTDPTGYTARMEMVATDEAALEALELEVGQRYLVYTADYQDLDWELRTDIALTGHGLENSEGTSYGNPQIEYFYPENWKPFPDGYVEDMGWLSEPEYNVGWYEYEQVYPDGTTRLRGVHLTNLDMKKFRSVQLAPGDPGNLLSDAVPTLVKLDTTAEAFLSGAEGQLWQEYLQYMQVYFRAFAVLGVEDLMATGDFALEETAITAGRNFTAEELASGAKVCVISKEVASLSGLEIGDKITLYYYDCDHSHASCGDVANGRGTVSPSPCAYCQTSEMDSAGESYEIVGIYTREVPWAGPTSLYNFTVNTVFVPKASVTAEMQEGEIGLFLSLVIRNGALDDFEALAARDGHDGLFLTSDQGYEEIVKNLQDYATIARQAAAVGAAVYGVIMLLYLLLYPGMQSKNLKTMGSLGAGFGRKLGFMMGSSAAVLGAGTALGGLLGALLWDKVTDTLTQSARVSLQLELEPEILAAIAGGQLLLAAVAVLLLSLPMCRHNRLLERQSFFKKLSQKFRRTPRTGWGVVIFAAVIALVLCALQAANEEEYRNYEVSVREAPVTVTLVDPANQDPYNLNASGFIMDLMYDERYARFTPMKYLKDFQYMTSLQIDTVNGYSADVQVLSFASAEKLPEGVEVTWFEGYDDSLFDSDSMFLLVPETMPLRDCSQSADGIQVMLSANGRTLAAVTVAGTYRGGNGSWLYSSGTGMRAFCDRTGMTYLGQMAFTLSMYQMEYETLIGLTSKALPPNLTAQRNCVITWYEGFDATCLDSEEEMFLLMPEKLELEDIDKTAPGTQVRLYEVCQVFGGYINGQPQFREMEYECIATVAGTYTNSIDSPDIYCSFEPLLTCAARSGQTASLNYVSATMLDNTQQAELREMCNEWFNNPEDPEMMPAYYQGYTLVINNETLENLRTTLENSIAVNEICTLLVFVLSAGAGFFLGFLMIRSRKREIILMRTLGRANFSIYLSYAFEQMLCILAGAALGGLAFQWHPIERLGIFVGIYFVGLSAALILFLNSKLLTNVKEDE